MVAVSRFRIKLSTLFIVTLSIAVGLCATIGPKHRSLDNFSHPWGLLVIVWEFSLAFVACELIHGLLSQLRVLCSNANEMRLQGSQRLFSCRIAWLLRVILILVLAACLFDRIVVTQKLWEVNRAKPHEIYFGLNTPIFSEGLFLVALLAAIAFNQPDIPQIRQQSSRKPLVILWSIAGLLLALIALRELLIIHFLAYTAIAEIEAAQPLRFQRLEAYVNHGSKDFQFFWIACGGLVFLLAGGVAWLVALRSRGTRCRALLAVAGVAGISLAAAYASWYFTTALPSLAPDFAEAGLQSTASHWWQAAVLVGLIIPFIASRLAGSNDTISLNASNRPQLELPLPLGIFTLSFVSVAAICQVAAIFRDHMLDQFTGFSYMELTKMMLTDANIYLPMAVVLIIWTAWWKCWRAGESAVRVVVPHVDQQRFALACFALAIFIPVAIPTIAAFSFAAWFNPWSI